MEKIKSIKQSHLQNDEHYSFNSEVLKLIEAADPKKLDIKDEYPEYKAAFDDEDRSSKIISKSADTAQLAQDDSLRDSVLVGLGMQVRGNVNHYDSAISKAAYRLEVLIDGYGSVRTQSYDKETASITNLLQDLRSAKYAADVEKLALAGWITQLENANNTFVANSNARYGEQTDKDSLTRLRTARLATDEAYKVIVERINAGVVYLKTDKYDPFVQALNTRIDHYKTLVAQRQGRNEAKKKEEN